MRNHGLKLKAVLAICLAVLVFAFSVLIFLRAPNKKADVLHAFAQCLADKGVTMYGAYWCPHCQSEKAAFGDSFKLVNYVECTRDAQKCVAAGIKGYPTWIFPASPADGKKARALEGEQGLDKLSAESGCPLAAEDK